MAAVWNREIGLMKINLRNIAIFYKIMFITIISAIYIINNNFTRSFVQIVNKYYSWITIIYRDLKYFDYG